MREGALGSKPQHQPPSSPPSPARKKHFPPASPDGFLIPPVPCTCVAFSHGRSCKVCPRAGVAQGPNPASIWSNPGTSRSHPPRSLLGWESGASPKPRCQPAAWPQMKPPAPCLSLPSLYNKTHPSRGCSLNLNSLLCRAVKTEAGWHLSRGSPHCRAGVLSMLYSRETEAQSNWEGLWQRKEAARCLRQFCFLSSFRS